MKVRSNRIQIANLNNSENQLTVSELSQILGGTTNPATSTTAPAVLSPISPVQSTANPTPSQSTTLTQTKGHTTTQNTTFGS